VKKRTSPDFGRWAITGAIAPAVIILVVTFVIAPFAWPDLAVKLGNALGEIFVYYLFVLVVAAVIWKVWTERKHRATKKG